MKRETSRAAFERFAKERGMWGVEGRCYEREWSAAGYAYAGWLAAVRWARKQPTAATPVAAPSLCWRRVSLLGQLGQ